MVAGADDVGTRPVDQAGVPEHRVDLADAGLQPVAEQDLQSRVMTLPFSELARPRPRTRPFSWVGRYLSWPGAGYVQRQPRMARRAQKVSTDERVLLEPAFGVLLPPGGSIASRKRIHRAWVRGALRGLARSHSTTLGRKNRPVGDAHTVRRLSLFRRFICVSDTYRGARPVDACQPAGRAAEPVRPRAASACRYHRRGRDRAGRAAARR